jgi:hypothetical protein
MQVNEALLMGRCNELVVFRPAVVSEVPRPLDPKRSRGGWMPQHVVVNRTNAGTIPVGRQLASRLQSGVPAVIRDTSMSANSAGNYKNFINSNSRPAKQVTLLQGSFKPACRFSICVVARNFMET